MIYNETVLDNADGTGGYVTAINSLSGQLLMSLVLLVVFIMCIASFRNELEKKKNFIVSSAITSGVTILFLLKQWVSLYIAWVPFTLLAASIMYDMLTED